ncbi:dendrite reproteinration, partial [Branchiostoma belcheri]
MPSDHPRTYGARWSLRHSPRLLILSLVLLTAVTVLAKKRKKDPTCDAKNIPNTSRVCRLNGAEVTPVRGEFIKLTECTWNCNLGCKWVEVVPVDPGIGLGSAHLPIVHPDLLTAPVRCATTPVVPVTPQGQEIARDCASTVFGGITYLIWSVLVNIDECAADIDNCAQVCINTDGSFTCGCNDGYVLNADGVSCDDVDECAADTDNCAQTCTNTVGSFTCGCNDGYVLNTDGFSCDDVDECLDNNGGCAHDCDNTVGSFTCSCLAGFILADDGLNCDPEPTGEMPTVMPTD